MNQLTSAARSILCASICTVASFSVSASEAQDAAADPELAAQWASPANPAREPYAVQYINAVGSGCRPFTWAAGLASDGDSFRLRFARFSQEVSPESRDASATCQLAIAVNVPVGYSFRVAQFSYRGQALLDEGVAARLSTTYAFTGDPGNAEELHATLNGPYDDAYTIDDKSSKDGLWSPCNRNTTQVLNVVIKADLRSRAPGGEGRLDVDEAYGISLKWGRCQGFNGNWDPRSDRDPSGNRNPNGNWNPNGVWNPNASRDGRGGPVIVDVDRDRNPGREGANRR